MITAKNISKSYGRLEVLKNISLSLKPGKITAILGPNGSGKTTLIKTILGLVHPDGGDLFYDNKPVLKDDNFRSYVGYMPQTSHFPDNLKVPELIRLIADLRSTKVDPEYYVQYFDLKEHYNKPLSSLSGGSRQKVSAILAFIFDLPVIILDEPTVGLDPVSSLKLKELLIRERDKGKTILFTSHIIPTVEEIADELVFILEGNIHFTGTVGELNDSLQQSSLEKSIANLLQKQESHEQVDTHI